MKDFFDSAICSALAICIIPLFSVMGVLYLFIQQGHHNFMEVKQQVIECRVKVPKDLISQVDKICGALPPYSDNE